MPMTGRTRTFQQSEDGKYYAVKFMKKHEIIKLKQATGAGKRTMPYFGIIWIFFIKGVG